MLDKQPIALLTNKHGYGKKMAEILGSLDLLCSPQSFSFSMKGKSAKEEEEEEGGFWSHLPIKYGTHSQLCGREARKRGDHPPFPGCTSTLSIWLETCQYQTIWTNIFVHMRIRGIKNILFDILQAFCFFELHFACNLPFLWHFAQILQHSQHFDFLHRNL